MILTATEWIYSKLSSDVTLTALLAYGGGLVYFFPNSFEKLPVVAYSVSQYTSDMDFKDDSSFANDITANVDIYVKNGDDTTPLMQAVDSVLTGLLMTLDYCNPVGDPSSKTQHVTMRFSRNGLLPSEII